MVCWLEFIHSVYPHRAAVHVVFPNHAAYCVLDLTSQVFIPGTSELVPGVPSARLSSRAALNRVIPGYVAGMCYTARNMKIQIITLFPEVVEPYLHASMLWKAQDKGIVSYSCINLRQFGLGPRRQVDDTPYGGGDGMLLKPEPLVTAIEAAKAQSPQALVILPTPRGELYRQSDAKQLAAAGQDLVIVCPRYEGYDERITNWIDKQYCIGNYVLTGGELPAMVIVDSVVRLLPGVLGGEMSAHIESFQDDDQSIEFPQYTRPENFHGLKVPEVLLTGNHGEIAKWRNSQVK
jgi:tRNA (guanine37-N1)-methyltransferase